MNIHNQKARGWIIVAKNNKILFFEIQEHQIFKLLNFGKNPKVQNFVYRKNNKKRKFVKSTYSLLSGSMCL